MLLLNRYYAHSVTRAVRRLIGAKANTDLIQKNQSVRILVVLHLFYPQSWKEIKEYLRNLDAYPSWDLAITVPSNVFDPSIEQQVMRDFPRARLHVYENYGFDIGPFLELLGHVDVDAYDVIFKLQSKGVRRKAIFIYDQLFVCRDWMLNLFEGVAGPTNVHRVIDLVTHGDAGIVCASNLLVHDPPHKRHMVNRILRERGYEELGDKYRFVAGTCFAFSPAVARRLQSLGLVVDDFRALTPPHQLTFAHAMERYMCAIVPQVGQSYAGTKACALRRVLKEPLRRYLHKHSSERLFDLPYGYDDEFFMWQLDNRLIRYRVREVEVGNLKYKGSITPRTFRLEETYPYRYLCGDEQAYEEYCEHSKDTVGPHMSKERFEQLITSIRAGGYDPRRIVIVDPFNVIIDGQHRACCIAYDKGLDHRMDVLEVRGQGRYSLLGFFMPLWLWRIHRAIIRAREPKA